MQVPYANLGPADAPTLNWRSLYGCEGSEGLSLTWHEGGTCPVLGEVAAPADNVLELCLNLEGTGEVVLAQRRVAVPPHHACLRVRVGQEPELVRHPHEQHRFLIASFSYDYLRRTLQGCEGRLRPLVAAIVAGKPPVPAVAGPFVLSGRNLELVSGLREPPVAPSARAVWYRGKAMELVAEFLFRHEDDDGLFCSRRRRVAQERTGRVQALLREHLAEPLPLEELARRVGCSPHHLSRTFSSILGCTIPQYLRQLRMEQAARLLRSGRYNVTETAMEVGYSSLSHFIQTFQETHGCLPGGYAQAGDTK